MQIHPIRSKTAMDGTTIHLCKASYRHAPLVAYVVNQDGVGDEIVFPRPYIKRFALAFRQSADAALAYLGR